jgi:hypothetical protein
MGTAASKRKVKNAKKNLIQSIQQEVDFAERLVGDRKWFAQTPSADIMNKGSFLLSIYSKLSSSALHLYKISHRIKLQKAKKDNAETNRTATEVQKQLEAELTKGRGDWQNADAAANWFLHDYDLSSKAIQLQYFPDQSDLIQEKGGDKETQRRMSLERLETETRRLRTEALEVGFHFLDSNYSGYLEPTDIPNLPVPVFARLDTTGKHRLRWQDVRKAVGQMEMTVNNGRAGINRLNDMLSSPYEASRHATDQIERERTETQMMETRAERDSLVSNSRYEEKILNEVYEFFRQAFTRNVFDVLPFGSMEILPTLSQTIRKTSHVEEIPAAKTTGPWISRLGADILHPEQETAMGISLVPVEPPEPARDMSFMNVPHSSDAQPSPTWGGLQNLMMERHDQSLAENLHQIQDDGVDAPSQIQEGVAGMTKSLEDLKILPTTTTQPESKPVETTVLGGAGPQIQVIESTESSGHCFGQEIMHGKGETYTTGDTSEHQPIVCFPSCRYNELAPVKEKSLTN